MFKKRILFCVIVLLLIIPNLASAHGIFLELDEPGVLQVEYDGGGFSPRTEVIIFDEKDNELGKGLIDEDGKFHFDKNLDVHRAVADDGMGHRAEYKKGVVEKSIPKMPVVIGVFALVGVIFIVYNRKGKKV